MAHQCNYYCHDTVHAFQVLAPAAMPLAQQTAQLRHLMATRGYVLLDVRPAREADIDAWRAAANVSGYVDARGVHIGGPRDFAGRAPQVPLIAMVDVGQRKDTACANE